MRKRNRNPGWCIKISTCRIIVITWVDQNLDGLSELTPKSARCRVYEVDISYPQHLHDMHNDLPFLLQNSIPHGSKVRKLMATFERKENYIVHYRNLQQAIDNELIVEKVHRVLEFIQSDWLAKYIQLNTKMRKKARNEFLVFNFSVQFRTELNFELDPERHTDI
ncbi:unnamed protein product [Aphis gossypii]|uniref:Uncharacterized protein n=1 Tax=Aphis gossypii TaxID=80765 RepID=A0A9P0NQ27_APHGO|nr:unnamed protein product [Aphis gossypii]